MALLERCDHASVTVLTPHYVETVAVSDDVARRGDGWQHDLSEGPAPGEPAAAGAGRQPGPPGRPPLAGLGPTRRRAARRAVGGLAARWRPQGGGVGALNLYADRPQAWDAGQRALAASLAGQVAVAAADARLLDARTAAMLARSGVGQAQGMVMERFGLTAEQAFDYLQGLSRDTGVGLLHVAEHLVETRDLPPR